MILWRHAVLNKVLTRKHRFGILYFGKNKFLSLTSVMDQLLAIGILTRLQDLQNKMKLSYRFIN